MSFKIFEPTMAEFCQMLSDQIESGEIYGFNLPNSGVEQVLEDIQNLRYYADDRPMIEDWSRRENCFQIDDKYIIVMSEDFSKIDTVVGMYEIKKWVLLNDMLAVSGHDNILLYDRINRRCVVR